MDDLQLETVRVVEEHRVVPGEVRVLLRLALELDGLRPQPVGALVHLRPRVRLEGDVVDADAVAVEADVVDARRRELEFAASDLEELRHGVHDYLVDAQRLGLERAIVSSSSEDWINRHLERLELLDGWSCIVAANGDAARAKPRPTLYLEALDRLGVAPSGVV